jgi:hypothetical protein
MIPLIGPQRKGSGRGQHAAAARSNEHSPDHNEMWPGLRA